MKKKLSIFLCITLIISAFTPTIAIVLAKKPDQTSPPLEKIVIIHYKKGHAKPPHAGGGKKDSEPYKLLGKGVAWREFPVDFVINPDNPDGLSEGFIVSAITSSAEEWDSHTGTNLFGTYSIDHTATWRDDDPDGENELVFGDYPTANVIAVTVIWGYFSVPPPYREIVEFDILFDTDYEWGDATIDKSLMDLQNIATHELGHGAGLADLYDTTASEQTMYGYSTEGETKKRTLEAGDIAGIQKLYGE